MYSILTFLELKQKWAHTPKDFQRFLPSMKLIILLVLLSTFSVFIFSVIFFLEGSGLQSDSYMGKCRLLEDTCFVSPWEYCKCRYRNTVQTLLNWALQCNILRRKNSGATLVMFSCYCCAVSSLVGLLFTRRHLLCSCIIAAVLFVMWCTTGGQRWLLRKNHYCFNLSFQWQLHKKIYYRNLS